MMQSDDGSLGDTTGGGGIAMTTSTINTILQNDDDNDDDVDDDDETEEIKIFERWQSGADLMNFRVGRAVSGFIKDLSVTDVKFEDEGIKLEGIDEDVEGDSSSAAGEQQQGKSGSMMSGILDFFSMSFRQNKDGSGKYDERGLEMEEDGDDSSSSKGGSSVGSRAQSVISVKSTEPLQGAALWQDFDDGNKSTDLSGMWSNDPDYIENQQNTKKKRVVMICAGSILLLSIMTLTLYAHWWDNFIHATNQGIHVDHNNNDDQLTYDDNTLNESKDQSTTNDEDDLKDLLITISPALKREHPHSPQRMAYDWILSQNLPLSNYRIIQRYVLAVLYYSTEGGEWTVRQSKKNDWMNVENECSWIGVRCLDFRSHRLGESVTVLNMEDANMRGSIPMEIGELPFLELLHLQKNQLTGLIPETIVTLTNLRELRLEENALTGRIPNYLGNLKHLEYLSLSKNNFIGTLPSGLDKLTSMKHIDLGHNAFKGPIPREIQSWDKIERINLSANQFTGVIPEWMGSLTTLQLLGLSSNKLTGTIPESISEFTNLEELYIANNQLTGRIPRRMGWIKRLLHIDIGGNRLTGNIPHSFVNMERLELFYVHDNRLQGNVPDWFGTTSPLHRLTLHKNDLSGVVPERLCEENMMLILTADCKGGSEAKVQCKCCTECFE